MQTADGIPYSEWSKNDYNLHSANIKVLEHASYKHIAGKTLTRWTQTAERMTQNLQIL